MPRLMLECALRAALVALGTAGVLQLLRVKAPRARHAAWAGVMVLMLLLPVWTAWGPRAAVPLLPARPASARNAQAAFSIPGLPPAMHFATVAPARPVFRWTWRMLLVPAYLLGASILLGRLLLGTLRARRLVRRSVSDGGRLTNPACATPITVGWLRPEVILPSSWRDWPEAQLDAVETHEGEHRRRRDPLMQWLALLNRALFWFHPLAWWLERRLSALAEEACDAAVLSRGHDPYDYSGYLLDLARSMSRSGHRVDVVGMAMPGSSLPRRIRQIVGQSPAPRITRARALCLAAACLTISAVFAAATVDRRQFVPDPPPPPVPPAAVVAAVPPAPQAPLPPQQPAPPARPLLNNERRLVILYFDLRGTSTEAQARPRAAALQFVQQQMGSDRVAVLTAAEGDVRVLQDFTDDREKLTAAIQRMALDLNSAPDAHRRWDGLLSAVQKIGRLSEKKALIYFGPPLAGDFTAGSDWRRVVDALAGSNVAVFPVDVSGLGTLFVGQPYLLAPLDQISVSMWREPEFDGTYLIRPDGMISVPLLGPIKAAGLTATELQEAIDREASRLIRDPRSTVSLLAIHADKK